MTGQQSDAAARIQAWLDAPAKPRSSFRVVITREIDTDLRAVLAELADTKLKLAAAVRAAVAGHPRAREVRPVIDYDADVVGEWTETSDKETGQ